METQVQKIISPHTRSLERLEAYQFFIRFVQENDIPAKFLSDFNSMLDVLKQDIKSEEIKLSLESLHLIGIFLRTEVIVNVIEEKKLSEIIDDLYSLTMISSEKMICTRALWCLAKLKIPLTLWMEKLDKIMEIIERPQPDDPKQISGSYELEIIRVLNRLLTEMPEQMALRVSFWSRRLYLATVCPTPKVREPAFVVLDTFWMLIQKQQTHSSLITLQDDLKEKLVPGMSRMFKEKQEIQSLKLWRLLLKILGKTLHQGASLINTLLGIVEKGFKSANPEVKVEAFKSWHQLIMNFGSELEVLANPKRLRLVMQPLKANNARTEIVANTKFKVWWFLIVILGPKLIHNVEIVLYPFLQFCFGLEEPSGNQTLNQSHNSNNSNTSDKVQKMNNSANHNTSPNSLNRLSPIHRSACEALAQILTHKSEIPITRPHFIVDELPFILLEPQQKFLHHCRILLSCVRKAIIGLGSDKKNLPLQLYLLHNAVSHVKINADGENKKEFSEALSLLLFMFEEFVKDENLSPDAVLKFLEVSIFIPKKVLHSSAYTIEEVSVMSGTPSLFLIKLLFRNPLLTLSETERFGSIFQKLITRDEDSTVDTLSFTELVIKTMDSASADIAHSETLFLLWNMIAANLLDKIEITNEINQGDSLEHDFGCIYATLLFPINHLYDKPLLQSSIKTLDTTWIKLCRKLGSLKDLAPEVPVNIWCEEFSLKILNNISDDLFKVTLMQQNLSNLLLEIINFVDFSSVEKLLDVAELNESFTKRKSNSLGFVTAFISLYNKLTSSVVDTEKELLEKPQSTMHTTCNTIVNLANVACILFTKITFSACLNSLLSQLSKSVSNVFEIADKIKSVPENPLLEMWIACSNSIKIKHNETSDIAHNECFRLICPLIEASLKYSKLAIWERTCDLWRETFMLSPAKLNLPESFKDVFRQLKMCSVPESGRQVANALSEIVRMAQEETNKVKNVKVVVDDVTVGRELTTEKLPVMLKQTPTSDTDTISPQIKRRRINDQGDSRCLSTEISALYVIKNSTPILPSGSIQTENQLNLDREIAKSNTTAQVNIDLTPPKEKVIEIDTSQSHGSSVEFLSVSIASPSHCVINLSSQELDTSNSKGENTSEGHKDLEDVEIIDKIEPELITNGAKCVALGGNDDDDVIPSSQSVESVVISCTENGNKRKSTNAAIEAAQPLPKLAKETTKHKARRSMRLVNESPAAEISGNKQIDTNENKSVLGKRRRKSSHHVREDFDSASNLKSDDYKSNEKASPEDKRKSKTARKSFYSTPIRFQEAKNYDEELSRISEGSTNNENKTSETFLHSARRRLHRHLGRSDQSIGELLQSDFNEGIKPMEVDGEGSTSSPVSKFENLVKSPILSDSKPKRNLEEVEMYTSTSDLFSHDSISKKLIFNDSLEEDKMSSPDGTSNNSHKLNETQNDDSDVECLNDSKADSTDLNTSNTSEEERNTTVDLNAIGSELSVGSEVVVNVSSEEKENELYITAVEVDQNKSEQVEISNVQQQDIPIVKTKELRSDKTKGENSLRRGNLRVEGALTFTQRFIKTYSKGTPLVNAAKTEPALPLKSSAMQRAGSRGWKILEAAKKQNLNTYEKVMYENKKISPDKSQERQSSDFFKSLSPERIQTPLGTPERVKSFKHKLYSISPSGSPSVGILKKQLKRLEVPLGGSPSSRGRRVSFAEPLVQVSNNVPNEEQNTAKTNDDIKPLPSEPVSPVEKEAKEILEEKMPILEKQIPCEFQEMSICNAESAPLENVVESPVIEPPQLDIAIEAVIESSVEEIGANAEIDTVIETDEIINENPESKPEKFVANDDEIVIIKSDIELNQKDDVVMIDTQETCLLNASSEVPEMQMEVLVAIDNQQTVKQGEPVVHVVNESGDASEMLLNKSNEFSDVELSEMMNNLNSKFTAEKLSKTSNSQLLSFQQQLLNMALSVTNALKMNQKEIG